jgi:hypothetical protein
VSIPPELKFVFYNRSDDLIHSTDESGALATAYVQNLATHTLITGVPSNWPSPCGVNCSFTLALDIPFLDCNTTTFRVNFTGTSPESLAPEFPAFNATWMDYSFNVATYYELWEEESAADGTAVSGSAITQANNTICSPSRGNYALDVVYANNVQKMKITRGVVTPLDIQSPAPPTSSGPTPTEAGPAVEFPGFMIYSPGRGAWYGVEALNWTEPFVSWYRDLQLMGLIDGLANSLAGTVLYS